MSTVESVLRSAIQARGDTSTLVLERVFQGLPEMAHGGSVLAAFDAVAGPDGPRSVTGLYRRRVPLGVPLRLEVAHTDGEATCRLLDTDAVLLVDGRLRAGVTLPAPAPLSGADGVALPLSPSCFACGIDNPLGLQARLRFDEVAVHGVWDPREPFAAADGSLTPAALTTLLDEAAFWLGALATGESGMTTDLRVALGAAVPFGTPIAVEGLRASVRARPEDARYWDTEVVARDPGGDVIAAARITFVAVRGAARKLARGLLSMNPPDLLRRIFPAYTT